ncbi:NAD-dependent deacylase [Silvibacterium dinghuense]|uniref:NAD-dependent protein deacylase n=1 Tax=Silvibacterium dinghuense TaxID=1560006 RepID=A0A4Q1SGZ6_9BACT|nr:NAD-dependent deacylase [Silvibacterium dinghuense]RXS96603.1 NAD-dependent deacylase [Silvibacterium dinghuense]GGG92161.1 NAD-dependent protein deacylase [Silvibacterium dinghuense]
MVNVEEIGPVEIGEEDRLFVLTGAGVSAESGLPTFRDNGGLWNGYLVEDVATPEAWHEDAEQVWRFYAMRRRDALSARPNAAHTALARLEQRLGDRFYLCTQNVDDLHERAGSKRVVHMHGELFRSRCERACGRGDFFDEGIYTAAAEIPRCTCGGRIRPHIVWFGETPLFMDEIYAEIERCTMLLVAGSSGAVYPAAGFVQWARRRGLRTFYVGPELPLNASQFTERVMANAGEALPRLFP